MPIHKIFFYLFLLFLPAQLGQHWWPEWSLVWGLRVDYLAPTVYLSDILLGLTLVAWGTGWNWSNWPNLANWKKKVQSYKATKLQSKKQRKLSGCLAVSLSSCIFLLFLVLNFHAAALSQLWLYKFAKLVELVLLGVYVAKTTQNRADFRRIINLLLIGAVFESGLAIAQFIKQGSIGGIFWWLGERTFNVSTPGIAQIALKNPLTPSQSLWLRSYGTFSHPNSLAGYLLVILILALINPKSEYRNSKQIQMTKIQMIKTKKCFEHLFPFVGFILTFSRSAWLVGLILLTIYLILIHGFPISKSKKAVKTDMAIAIPISTKADVKQRFWGIFVLLIVIYTLFFILYSSTITDSEGLAKRWSLTVAAWEMTKASPLIGVGLGHFIPNLINYPQKGFTLWLQPVHNIFLLVMAETGLIGLVGFLAILGSTYKKLLHGYMVTWLKRKGRKPFNHLAIQPLIFTLTAILLTGMLDHYWLTLQQNQLLFALIIGLCWSRLKPTT